MQQFIARLTKVEEDNIHLNAENKEIRKELEELNVTLKFEFDRFAKERKKLDQNFQIQNEKIVTLASRVESLETTQVIFW